MPDIGELVEQIAASDTWNGRVALIRKIPELFGTGQHQAVYAAIARETYLPHLAPDFAYVHWVDDYELSTIEAAYQAAVDSTARFTRVAERDLADALTSHPVTLRIFRLLLGLTTQEFAASTVGVVAESGGNALSNNTVKGIEAGRTASPEQATTLARTISRGMTDTLFPPAMGHVRAKIRKPDTSNGWDTVRTYADQGVPLSVFLHQRFYGGSFRQLLDATSTRRGDVLEDAVEETVKEAAVPYVRTGAHNQAEIEGRFGLTIKPAPDFVFHDKSGTLRGILECKGANDGGTARDKAARFRGLRQESVRLGGVPLFAVIGGLGWARVADALGPVIHDTEGRTFTLSSLPKIVEVDPFPQLIGP